MELEALTSAASVASAKRVSDSGAALLERVTELEAGTRCWIGSRTWRPRHSRHTKWVWMCEGGGGKGEGGAIGWLRMVCVRRRRRRLMLSGKSVNV